MNLSPPNEDRETYKSWVSAGHCALSSTCKLFCSDFMKSELYLDQPVNGDSRAQVPGEVNLSRGVRACSLRTVILLSGAPTCLGRRSPASVPTSTMRGLKRR